MDVGRPAQPVPVRAAGHPAPVGGQLERAQDTGRRRGRAVRQPATTRGAGRGRARHSRGRRAPERSPTSTRCSTLNSLASTRPGRSGTSAGTTRARPPVGQLIGQLGDGQLSGQVHRSRPQQLGGLRWSGRPPSGPRPGRRAPRRCRPGTHRRRRSGRSPAGRRLGRRSGPAPSLPGEARAQSMSWSSSTLRPCAGQVALQVALGLLGVRVPVDQRPEPSRVGRPPRGGRARAAARSPRPSSASAVAGETAGSPGCRACRTPSDAAGCVTQRTSPGSGAWPSAGRRIVLGQLGGPGSSAWSPCGGRPAPRGASTFADQVVDVGPLVGLGHPLRDQHHDRVPLAIRRHGAACDGRSAALRPAGLRRSGCSAGSSRPPPSDSAAPRIWSAPRARLVGPRDLATDPSARRSRLGLPRSMVGEGTADQRA